MSEDNMILKVAKQQIVTNKQHIPFVTCPKHGRHSHTIHSTIPGHEGRWCQICWLETLGPALPVSYGGQTWQT